MEFSKIISNSKSYVFNLLNQKLSQRIEFHNFNHAKSVAHTSKLMARFYNLSEVETTILIVSAWFHDVGYTEQSNGHEIISQNILQGFLKNQNVPKDFAKKCDQCIVATKRNCNPKSKVEAIIKDADFSHIMDIAYWDLNKKLKREVEFLNGITITEQKWYENNLEFLSSLSFCTDYYQKVFNEIVPQRVEENIAILEAL